MDYYYYYYYNNKEDISTIYNRVASPGLVLSILIIIIYPISTILH